MMQAVLATSAGGTALFLHSGAWLIAGVELGGGVPTGANPKRTRCDSVTVPPSTTHVDVALSKVSRRNWFVERSAYSRSRPNTEAARIFASAIELAVLRASPLNRKNPIPLPTICAS